MLNQGEKIIHNDLLNLLNLFECSCIVSLVIDGILQIFKHEC